MDFASREGVFHNNGLVFFSGSVFIVHQESTSSFGFVQRGHGFAHKRFHKRDLEQFRTGFGGLSGNLFWRVFWVSDEALASKHSNKVKTDCGASHFILGAVDLKMCTQKKC